MTPTRATTLDDSLKPLEIKQNKPPENHLSSKSLRQSKSLSALNRPLANATPNLDAELQQSMGNSAGPLIDTKPSVFLRRALEMRTGTAGKLTVRPSRSKRRYVRSPKTSAQPLEPLRNAPITQREPSLRSSPGLKNVPSALLMPLSPSAAEQHQPRRRRSSVCVVMPAPHVLNESTKMDANMTKRKQRTHLLRWRTTLQTKLSAFTPLHRASLSSVARLKV